jgi:hypothetical protein
LAAPAARPPGVLKLTAKPVEQQLAPIEKPSAA